MDLKFQLLKRTHFVSLSQGAEVHHERQDAVKFSRG